MVFLALSAFAVSKNYAQEIVVRARLHGHGPELRGERPSRRHKWVSEEWTPSGGTYVYKAGYWAVPPRPDAYWMKGHWRRRHGGYVWIPGHWA